MRYYAHTLPPPKTEAEWEPLEVHLREVAEQAMLFASAFDAGEWGNSTGMWHDLGKYASEFQAYLKRSAMFDEDDPHLAEQRGTVNHSTAGAIHAHKQLGASGRLLAYCIAGHHGGLPNTIAADGQLQDSGLERRLNKPPATAHDALDRAPAAILNPAVTLPLPPIKPDRSMPGGVAFQLAFFTRMIFSCLVDADYLATEAFYASEKSSMRANEYPSLGALAGRLDEYLRDMQSRATECEVNHHRNVVLQACREAATEPPGLFTLTVPTGGGKTLSSLAFALRHAHEHALRRVIVAIPFTSIIEQNVNVYRRALGDVHSHIPLVLEHHSNLDPKNETERSRLAAENWDAPVVVTTNVQLLESLFAARPGRCRKLHRIARSVIVLDEAQALPPNLLAPTVAALRELVTNYGCSVVLCTATQPALEKRRDFHIGFEQPRPIMPEPRRDALFAALKRVETKHVGQLDYESLVSQLVETTQVLCIVNTRGHAAELYAALCERLGETRTIQRRNGDHVPRVETCLHLSANMCPRHRTAVLRLIRRRLEQGRPCRVISTQLVEAGVDIDFPVVYRAMAGLDAIAQAAGRCNREGRLPKPGRVVIFEPDKTERQVPSFVRQAIDDAREALAHHAIDPLSPEAQHLYFKLHYWKRGRDDGSGWDQPPGTNPGDEGVMACFADDGDYLQFRQAAERYRLIADNQLPLLIRYGRRGRDLIDQLQRMPEPPGRAFNQRLQRLIVTVHEHVANQLVENHVLLPEDQVHGRYVLGNPAAYDRRLGVRLDVVGMAPETLMT